MVSGSGLQAQGSRRPDGIDIVEPVVLTSPSTGRTVAVSEGAHVFTVMTWNLENLFSPDPAARIDHDAKLDAIVGAITAEAPDLLAVQEVGDDDAFTELCNRLGPPWTGALSTHFESPHTIRVGWLSPRPLTDVGEVVDFPAALSPVTVDDDGVDPVPWTPGCCGLRVRPRW